MTGPGAQFMVGTVRRFAGRALVATAPLLTTGCGDPAPTTASNEPLTEPIVTCIGVPQATCAEAVGQIRANGSDVPATMIRIQCNASSCTAPTGSASVDILYASGERTSSIYGWGTNGEPVEIDPPMLPVPPTCIGLDQARCRSMAEGALGGRAFPPPIRSITVTCDGVCGPLNGAGTTVITYADRTTDDGSWSYSGG